VPGVRPAHPRDGAPRRRAQRRAAPGRTLPPAAPPPAGAHRRRGGGTAGGAFGLSAAAWSTGRVLTVRHTSSRPLDVALTLGPLSHGAADPTFQRAPDGSIWRTSLLRSGPVTQRFVPAGPHAVTVHLWGDGAHEAADAVPTLLGEDDDPTGFTPPPQVREAHRRAVGMRMPRSDRVLEALVPAVLEQRVQTVTAHRAWRRLVRRFGSPAPGPAPGLFVVPDARTWARIPVWEWHQAGVDPGRARTVARCALVAPRLEEA